ncbi:discoidin domain-containing protein [Nocardioides sp. GY 10127]|uniref:discoidin domain-containing protein n=1 Tax=Nocardioides sp. GY 10127 TaxID=2569762 RepID=UPI0010A76321|nr:discoidin domain-containing protein [Nocardioides sp. GY 10127]TIC79271.1 hypothetical protein E8D37_16820 [Nocardioides sp. GY 10127]
MTSPRLSMVLDTDHRALVSSLRIDGVEVLDAGMFSALQVADGDGLDSRHLDTSPAVSVHGATVSTSFTQSDDDVSVAETWKFVVTRASIKLHVERVYTWADGAARTVDHNGQLTIGWARTWDAIRRPDDGGTIPLGNDYTGKNGFYLNDPTDRYGVEESRFVMLRQAGGLALGVDATSQGRSLATEFSYDGGQSTWQETQVSAEPSWSYTAGDKDSGYVYGGHSSDGTDAYIYSPVAVGQGQDDVVDYTFSGKDYDWYYDVGTLHGVTDTSAFSSLLNDFGRSGVIDKDYGMSTVGLKYPGVGPYDMIYADRTVLGLDDPEVTASHQRLLEYFRDHAQREDGHMKGRTYHRDHTWGDSSLFDADPAYALSVAQMYDAQPDRAWLAGMRDSVQRSLGFMISDYYDEADGLFHNDVTSCTSTKGAREWSDAYFVRYESAYVNEQMYAALTAWADLERDVFGDAATAQQYSDLAARLKAAFNEDAGEGGFWDAGTNSYGYWQCPDGTVQARIQHTQVNLQAIYYGIADLDRSHTILDAIDQNMQRFHLPMLPLNFTPLGRSYEWSGDHFPTGLEDGAIYPMMTEEYMRAAATVGERGRSLDYLNNTVDRYTWDGFNGWSFVDWDLGEHTSEAWFPSNANGAGGLYTEVLGIQPTAEGVTVAPNIPTAMDGTSVTRAVHDTDTVTVTYRDELHQVVDFSSDVEPVTLSWSGQEPGARYRVVDNGVASTVTADERGRAVYTYTGAGEHDVRLVGGDAAGYQLPAPQAPDLAWKKTATASSSWEQDPWQIASVTDGQPYSVDHANGWSSDSQTDADHTEWLQVDLGAIRTINTVTLWPQNFDMQKPGTDFPIDFTIEVSPDGTSWTTVADRTDYPKPTEGGPQDFGVDATDARYVRITGTRLRADENGEYRMQLAEVEVFDR